MPSHKNLRNTSHFMSEHSLHSFEIVSGHVRWLQDEVLQRCEVRMAEAAVENSQLQAALQEALSRLAVGQSRLSELLSGRAEMRQRFETLQLAAEAEQYSLHSRIADLQVHIDA